MNRDLEPSSPNIGLQRTAPCGLAAEAGSFGVKNIKLCVRWIGFPGVAAMVLSSATYVYSPPAVAATIPAKNVCTSTSPSFAGPCKTIHARLRLGADTITVWIWPVGTKRYLGYPDWAPCDLPTNLALQQGNELYANIIVRPLSKQEPKHMQFVCIASASQVVARDVP
jgi:hypothetical protein